MNGGKQDVDEGGAREERVHEPEHEAEEPARPPQREEEREVEEREGKADDEVQREPDHARRRAMRRDGGAEQERNVHPRETELARRGERDGQHQRPRETARERRPHGHRWARATAALISARCTSACGKLPRKSRDSGSISSA